MSRRRYISDAILFAMAEAGSPILVKDIREQVSSITGKDLTVQRISQHLSILETNEIVAKRTVHPYNNTHEWMLL